MTRTVRRSARQRGRRGAPRTADLGRGAAPAAARRARHRACRRCRRRGASGRGVNSPSQVPQPSGRRRDRCSKPSSSDDLPTPASPASRTSRPSPLRRLLGVLQERGQLGFPFEKAHTGDCPLVGNPRLCLTREGAIRRSTRCRPRVRRSPSRGSGRRADACPTPRAVVHVVARESELPPPGRRRPRRGP